uniref:Myeloid leukemia factor n=1 Tax=Trichogramma kaykai TaxID=54128 RepID=A0ABD2XKY3_9HYME
MSMYGQSPLGDLEDDPIYGAHMQSMQTMQQMNNMMNSILQNPFGMMGMGAMGGMGGMGAMGAMGAPALMDVRPQSAMHPMQMSPFGFPLMASIGQMFSNMDNMGAMVQSNMGNMGNPNCHSFTSSSVMTMTSGSDGRPQIYQESTSTRVAPGGVKETKKTVSDSRTGIKKMAIGHHIGERAHILERERNYHSGEQEERQEFINLEEEEAETFNHEWQQKAKQTMGAIGGAPYRQNLYRPHQNEQLALPSTAPSRTSEPIRQSLRPVAQPRHHQRRPEHPRNQNPNGDVQRIDRRCSNKQYYNAAIRIRLKKIKPFTQKVSLTHNTETATSSSSSSRVHDNNHSEDDEEEAETIDLTKESEPITRSSSSVIIEEITDEPEPASSTSTTTTSTSAAAAAAEEVVQVEESATTPQKSNSNSCSSTNKKRSLSPDIEEIRDEPSSKRQSYGLQRDVVDDASSTKADNN